MSSSSVPGRWAWRWPRRSVATGWPSPCWNAGSVGRLRRPNGQRRLGPRVYAISPGSAEFLRGLAAWQQLPPERIAAIEMMDVHGDRGGAIAFSAYELGERALAWIVENRELCATLRRRGTDLRRGRRARAMRAEPRSHGVPTAPTVTLADGRQLSARLVVGADGVRSWVRREAGIGAGAAALWPDCRRRQFQSPNSRIGGGRSSGLSKATGCWHGCRCRGGGYRWCGRRPDALASELLPLDAAALARRVASAGGAGAGSVDTDHASLPRFPYRF